MPSIRQLAKATTEVHMLKYEYQGETYELPWMELTTGEEPKPAEANVDELPEAEKAEAMLAVVDDVARSCINKGLRAGGEEPFTTEEWLSIPKRIRMDIAQKMFVEKNELEARFLPGRPKTPN